MQDTPEIIAWILAIEPIKCDRGEDTLLRAIYDALTDRDFPVHYGMDWPYLSAALKLRLIRKSASQDGYFQVEPTEAGLLYWQMHGGKFSDFMHDCPPVPDLRSQPDTWQSEKRKMIEMIELLRSDLWHQVEGKHGPEKASQYHSITLADQLLESLSER